MTVGATAERPRSTPSRDVIASVLVALALAGVLLVTRAQIATSALDSGIDPYTAVYDPPRSGLEQALNQHDGQAFAALAQDPALQRPELFRDNRHEEAFRAGRPLLAWAAWALSAGQPEAVAWVLLVLSILGVGALMAAVCYLATTFGRDLDRVVWTLALPGSIVVLIYVGLSDAWGTAFALAGMALWVRGRHGPAAVVLALAILTRETGVVAVFALASMELRDRRKLALLASTAIPYAIWMVVIRLRLDTWSFAADPLGSTGARYTLPFTSLAKVMPDWNALSWLCLVVIVGLVVLGWRAHPPRPLEAFMALWIAVAVCMGQSIWSQPTDFPRVLLPLSIVAYVVALPAARDVQPSPPLVRAS